MKCLLLPKLSSEPVTHQLSQNETKLPEQFVDFIYFYRVLYDINFYLYTQ